ncbi:MAG: cytochrome c oxidase subunit II [Acidimicrobiales bacterium]|nr:cytochrome c oxidase subunit II [Acidimicrobiales bacterium]
MITKAIKKTWLALFASALLLVTGCAADAELDTLQPQGPTARDIDKLLDPVLIIAYVVFFLVFGATIFIWWKFRDRHEDEVFPTQVHGNTKLEILWTIIPTLILAVVSVFTLITLSSVNSTETNKVMVTVEEESVLWEPEVVVVGQQWWWEFRYYFDGLDGVDLSDARNLPPADIVTAGQLVMPTGQEIELSITSRDVIHSFWIPALNGKRDAAPGRVHPWKLEADEPGVYFGQCTEFCGLSHSRMRMQAIALEPEDFQTWVDQQLTDQDSDLITDEAVARGLTVFENQCARCHVVNGVNDETSIGADLVSNAAPNLTHFMSRTTYAGGIFNLYEPDGTIDRTQLEAWIRNAPAEKPAYAEGRRGMPALGLSEDEIDDVVAYLETLGAPPSSFIIQATEVE